MMNKTDKSDKNRLKNGKFAKGNCANPNGRNGRFEIKNLEEALEKEGKRMGTDFWKYVAKRTYTNDQILIAILKKIVPDKIKGEGFAGDKYIFIVKDAPKGRSNNRIQVPAASESADNQG